YLSYRGTQIPIVSQITFRLSKREAYSSISSSRRSAQFYEVSKHSSLAVINQELCCHSLRLHVVPYTRGVPYMLSAIFLA
ncbi:hypothetical protein LINPERPRIM_LOCUS22151, partial [Linum perenne]